MKKPFQSITVVLRINEMMKKTQKNHPGEYQGWFFFISFSLAGVRKGTSCVPHINKICFF